MPIIAILKKASLVVVLFGLAVLEVSLLEGFLPYEWPHPINQLTERLISGPTYAPHPNLSWELELYFRQNPWHRVVQFALLAILALGNAYLVYRVWGAFRHLKRT